MTVYINGAFVPEKEAVVPFSDRSFRYGDGLFETVLLHHGKPFRWQPHYERFRLSAEFLRMTLPCNSMELAQVIGELSARNSIFEGMARVTLSRGAGGLGYAPDPNAAPILIASTHPHPPRDENTWRLTVSSIRVAVGSLLQQHKTANRLPSVIASMEAQDRGAHEALLLDTNLNIVDGARCNVFWFSKDALNTVPVAGGALPGITRAAIFEICGALKIPVHERMATVPDLLAADGVFVTLSSRGAVEVSEIDGTALKRSPLLSTLATSYCELVTAECA